ncbi:DUF3006 domain-containing protein [Serpentinicella sp. ANB-PHB4]|uniref:DUF3006 domain-containing protein n=1 Tax=Serpentinicella sp. ANB-PHB4 TaxID=3074076 RepID=UPI00285A6587|nr:DUF3006 domain-containing protein [Serpentinicella sp. ANB-PHB4]MDR5658346.1 DUF3006 domain-containing protein [Serpentinicella sp. ANB-PHB4]
MNTKNIVGIIDRFEREYAVIELDNKIISINKNQVPPGAKEGDSINISTDYKITLNKLKTDERKNSIDKLMKELYK